ncbi:MAG TPA: N-acetylmuramoyl-L-alanine amidase [Longimicrobium sp.]|nr:N-acetylmuramoyl-L-alanine amidase [Longimicrobium sp.]
MAALRPDKVKYIVVHTAAATMRNVDAKEIDRWHKANGWQGIGYHYVILNDRHDHKAEGTLEKGRPIGEQGAHVAGINDVSVGICCVGDGDRDDFTPKQMARLLDLITELRRRFDVAVEDVIGHREVNDLIRKGIVNEKYKTGKTCPGRKVSMDEIRAALRERDQRDDPLPVREPDLTIIDPGTPDLVWLPNVVILGDERFVSDGEEAIV